MNGPNWIGEPGGPEDAMLETEMMVDCPHCGESVEIALDPAGGVHQEYVEDCAVCCRPWQVYVRYDSGGTVSVRLEPL